MALRLDEVVPWGRSTREYRAMFGLNATDLDRRIVDCAGGPSSFTAEMTEQSKQVISCDPLYQWSGAEISERIDETYPRMNALNEAEKDHFLWHEYGSPARLGQLRMGTMRRFLEDYPAGREQGRYVVGALPTLPFADRQFELGLCSHFLFTYSEQFSTEFHLQSLQELTRVALEVRVFPVLTAFSGEISPHLAAVMERLTERGYTIEVRTVEYEFQKGGNQMLCLRAGPALQGAGE